jgi:hypothetical protein
VTPEKVKLVCSQHLAALQAWHNARAAQSGAPVERLTGERYTGSENGRSLATLVADRHLVFMLEEIPKLLDEGRTEKAMRWLGFVQGAIWAYGLVSIDDLKSSNRPDERSTG